MQTESPPQLTLLHHIPSSHHRFHPPHAAALPPARCSYRPLTGTGVVADLDLPKVWGNPCWRGRKTTWQTRRTPQRAVSLPKWANRFRDRATSPVHAQHGQQSSGAGCVGRLCGATYLLCTPCVAQHAVLEHSGLGGPPPARPPHSLRISLTIPSPPPESVAHNECWHCHCCRPDQRHGGWPWAPCACWSAHCPSWSSLR